jgi:pimeloyl-ACP methyl ester carboxylesterase
MNRPVPMPIDDVLVGTFRTPDGTDIAWHDTGGDKPVIVLANGLGGPFSAWRYQVEFLRSRYRLVSWDYRGLYGSSRPQGEPPRLDIAAHVGDLEQLLEVAGIQRAAFIGWSMGVQVILDFYERHRQQVSHLVLINGTFGKPFDTLALPMAAKVVPVVLHQARRYHHHGSALLRRVTRWPETGLWLKRLGMIDDTLDEELFREMAGEFASLDLDIYFALLRSLGAHDAAHVLESIDVPTLVITGERDSFTPKHVAEQMARRIRGSEILVVRGATHYAAVEHPELVNLRIEKFFREQAYGAGFA